MQRLLARRIHVPSSSHCRRSRHGECLSRVSEVVLLVAAGCLTASVGIVAGSGVAEASTSSTAYIVNGGGNTVTPFNTGDNTAGTPISVGTNPYDVAITPNGATAYVSNAGSGTVTPISTATNTPGTPITVGTDPYGIAITPNGLTAFVANDGSNSVTPINTTTDAPESRIAVGSAPVDVAITPNGKTAYVANYSNGTVTPINTATHAPGAGIKVGAQPFDIAITPNGDTAYVVDNHSGTVTPINTATNTVETQIAVGSDPMGIAITPNGSTAYVANEGSGTVTPINTTTNVAGAPITITAGSPVAIAVSPDGSTAYVSGGSSVTPIHTSTNTAGTPISVGGSPSAGADGIAITPDQAPEAEFSVTPAPAGSPTSFDASGSVAPSSPITSYAWIFGDGDTETTSTPTTTHTYIDAGNYTASVTETDEADTSTTQVFTGQTMSNNGSTTTEASQSFVVVSCSADTKCSGTVSNASQSVSVAGTSSTDATLEISLGLQNVSCDSSATQSEQVTTYSTDNFTASVLKATLTVDDDSNTSDFEACYSSPTPFVDKQGASVTTGELADCSSNGNIAPCLSSVKAASGNLIAKLRVLPGDPRFWSPTVIASFSPTSGPVGTQVTIKGGPWTGVESVSFDGMQTQFASNTRGTRITAVVPAEASKGFITVVSPDGAATSTTKFKVTN
jgi:YVTN family beta-propeller protein